MSRATHYYISKVPNLNDYSNIDSFDGYIHGYMNWKEAIRDCYLLDMALKEKHPRIWKRLTSEVNINERELEALKKEFHGISFLKYNLELDSNEYELD